MYRPADQRDQRQTDHLRHIVIMAGNGLLTTEAFRYLLVPVLASTKIHALTIKVSYI
jgi:hypothetical protein